MQRASRLERGCLEAPTRFFVLQRPWQGSTVDDGGGWFDRSPFAKPNQRAQIRDDRPETPSPQPALGLLVDRVPRRQVVRAESA